MTQSEWNEAPIERKAAVYAQAPLRAMLLDLRQGIAESEHCYDCDCGADHPRERLEDVEAVLAAIVEGGTIEPCPECGTPTRMHKPGCSMPNSFTRGHTIS